MAPWVRGSAAGKRSQLADESACDNANVSA